MRNKYGEYVLDLSGLGQLDLASSANIDISDFVTDEIKKIMFGNNSKRISVILPEINCDDGTIQLLDYGKGKFFPLSIHTSHISVCNIVTTDENDLWCNLTIEINNSLELLIYFAQLGGE